MLKRRVVKRLSEMGALPVTPTPSTALTYDLKRGISYSRLSSFLACRQQCAYGCQGWQMIGSKESLTFGSVVHEILERVYTFARQHNNRPPSEKTLTGWLDPVGAAAIRKGSDAAQVEWALALADGLLPVYIKHHKRDWTHRSWLELESEFRVPFEGQHLFGYRDGLFRECKQLWLLETKTKSRISHDLENLVAFDAQNLYYAVATSIERNERIHGVLYNVVRKPEWREKDPKKIKDRARAEAEKSPKDFFYRYPVILSPKQVARYKTELSDKLEEFTQWLRGELPTYRNEGSCAGIWNCQYIPICATGSYVGFQKKP